MYVSQSYYIFTNSITNISIDSCDRFAAAEQYLADRRRDSQARIASRKPGSSSSPEKHQDVDYRTKTRHANNDLGNRLVQFIKDAQAEYTSSLTKKKVGKMVRRLLQSGINVIKEEDSSSSDGDDEEEDIVRKKLEQLKKHKSR